MALYCNVPTLFRRILMFCKQSRSVPQKIMKLRLEKNYASAAFMCLIHFKATIKRNLERKYTPSAALLKTHSGIKHKFNELLLNEF